MSLPFVYVAMPQYGRSLSVVLAVVVLVTAVGRAAEESRNSGETDSFARGDATSDPLLLLLRAPAIQRRLALRENQVGSLTRLISEIDEPLWRLRDAQFLNAANSAKAWQLIDQVESRLGGVLDRDQHTQFRQLATRARGIHALLSPDVIDGLKLSEGRARRIADVFENTRNETQRLREETADKDEAERTRQLEKLLVGERKKVAALLMEEQKRRWQRLAGEPFDFSKIPRRYVRAPEIRGVDEWINSAPLTLADLRGKVVVLHFFTFGCINCVHNQPAYKDWHERFSAKGAVVLGIHTPEGEGDRNVQSIRKSLQAQSVAYPVAIDNKKENWSAWANHTWPAVYLIDKAGYVRYWWYGELNWQGPQGEKLYREKIADLLAERDDSP